MARLIHKASGQEIAGRLEFARTTGARMRGLLGRAGLAPGEGLMIERCSSIHTFFMKFPLDVIFLDAAFGVRKVLRNLRPWRLAWAPGAWHVIELAAGALEGCPLAPGDVLEIRSS